MSKSAKSSDEVRIAVVDDHPIVQQALASLLALTEGWVVCGQAASAAKARVMIEKTRPQLVVVDISLEESHGLDLIRDLQVEHPKIKVLVFSHHDEMQYAERTIRAGSSGYVMKSEPPEVLVRAIHTVLAGEIHLSPHMNHLVVSHAFDRRKLRTRAPEPTAARLTDREITVLELLGSGMGTRQIAETLHLSIKTIDAHRANLKRKLGLRDAVELVVYASRWVLDNQNHAVPFHTNGSGKQPAPIA
jgi:DNA-binding NarL/FixJ family response regulator